MAAIAPVNGDGGRQYTRTATSQATVGQTDWLAIPGWATYAYVDFALTAVAGTTPTSTLSFVVPVLSTLDDTTGVVNLAGHTALTTLTGAARLLCQIGPGVTGIADDVTNAATGTSNVAINVVLPPIFGVKVLNDRGDADETYTYSLNVFFRK